MPLCSVLSLLSGSPNCWKCRNVTGEIYLVGAENSELGAIAERIVAVSSMPGSGLWTGGDGGRKKARASPKALRQPERWRGSTSSQGNRVLMCAPPPPLPCAGGEQGDVTQVTFSTPELSALEVLCRALGTELKQ